MTRSFHVLAPLLAGLLAACGGSDEPDTATLRLQLSGLEDLGPAAVYEGWLLVDGAPVTTGRFSVDGGGRLSRTEFVIPRARADRASAFVLTIEPAQGDALAPTDVHLLAGDFDAARERADVTIGHPAALGTNFAGAGGSFFLATPTSASGGDEDQGLWFLSMQGGVIRASLTLPVLPKGWVYEGWAVIEGQPVSTGRFTRPDLADSDGAGPGAGPLGAPPFPGQDFVNPPRRLPGGMAVISIEPEQDNSPAPFTLKPLSAPIGNGVGPGSPQTLINTVGSGSSLPRGNAAIVR